MEQESVRLLARYRDGDAAAADELFRRYCNRLTGLARVYPVTAFEVPEPS